MKRPTIREVARQAGVSVGTVSNVLNHAGGVRESTRARVEAAIEELGYRPDAIAQSLITRRSRGAGPAASRHHLPTLSAVGYISVDFTARIGVLPHRNDRVTAAGIDRSLGGPAANVAVHAAALQRGRSVNVELITSLGFDADSDWALAELHARGVSTIGIDRQETGRLSRCIVLLEAGGQRTIINEPIEVRPTNLRRHLGRARRSRRAPERHFLHVEGFQVPALVDSLPELRALGIRTSMHATGLPRSYWQSDHLRSLADAFDVMVLNREVAATVAGRSAGVEELVASIGETFHGGATPADVWVLLTLDREGAVLLRPGEAPWLMPAPAVPVTDLTGAGDAFTGIFLGRWLAGQAPLDALRSATVGASRTVTVEGAQGLLLSAEALDDLLAGAPSPFPIGHRQPGVAVASEG